MNKLFTVDETKDILANAGKDPEDGMEFLHGLEIKKDGEIYYDKESIDWYLNR